MDFDKIFHFLIDLQINNNRNWFNDNKSRYEEAKDEFLQFLGDFLPQLKALDPQINVDDPKKCMFRIYRDVRFSKNKAPYKTNFGAFFAKDGRKSGHAGYYMHIEPDHCFIGGGIYKPDAQSLKAIRQHIYDHPEDFKNIIKNDEFQSYFPEIHGEKLKRAPKDFPKEFKDIELLKHKSYAMIHPVSNEFWAQKDLKKQLLKIYKIQLPFNHFLNEAVD